MKNGFYPKFKTKLLTVLLVTFLLSALVGTLFVGEVSAIDYTEYTGMLNGADWALRIPDPWNSMVIVICRGFSPTTIPNPSTTLGFAGRSLLEAGFAVAAGFNSLRHEVDVDLAGDDEVAVFVGDFRGGTGIVLAAGLFAGEDFENGLDGEEVLERQEFFEFVLDGEGGTDLGHVSGQEVVGRAAAQLFNEQRARPDALAAGALF